VAGATMKRQTREYLRACAVSLTLVALMSGIASVPGLSVVGVLLAPGMLLAAVCFPEGGHSDLAFVYVILAMLIDSLLYSWPVLWIWRVSARRTAARHKPS